MRFTIVESPYAGDIQANTDYAAKACLDCIDRNENPFASHLFYTQFLQDEDEGQRECGIRCGYEWGYIAHYASKASINPAQVVVAFYVDRGWSQGMEAALERYTEWGLRCEIRRLQSTQNTPPVDQQS
jgi:hypothetical protein